MSSLKRSTSSKAHRVRTGWFLVVVDVEGMGKELHVGWKFYDGKIGLFTTSPKTCKTKSPWGCVMDCSYENVLNENKEPVDYLLIQNRSFQKKGFKVSEMNPFLWTVNDFTTLIHGLRCEGKLRLLSMYLALLPKSIGFTQHKEGVNDDLGFKADNSAVTEQMLEENGGSKKDFTDFVQVALSSAIVVGDRREIVEKLPVEANKKKILNHGPAKVKCSKAEKVAELRKAELSDKAGVEIEFLESFIGRADIPLSNLKVSSKVSLPVNQFKVRGLSTLMLENYDPSQMVLMVTPVDVQQFNKENLENNQFEIFHGRHRFLAVKEIEKKGRLGELIGMEQETITCHIMKIKSPVQANYGACRGNQIQATHTRKPFLHELIYVMDGIRKCCNEEKCQETMMRYGKLLSFGADELTALRKFATWSQGTLSDLVGLFKLYETLQTLDATEIVKRKDKDIKEGKTISFPHDLFKLLSKVDEEYFKNNVPTVRSKKMSMKDIILGFGIISKRRITASLIQEELGLQSFEQVKQIFPVQFEDKILDSFSGAKIGKKPENVMAESLREYCHSLLEEKDAIPKLTFQVVDTTNDVDVDSLNIYQTIVLNIKHVTNSLFQGLEIFKLAKSHVAIILLFSRQVDQVDAFEKLSTDSNRGVFNPRKICFMKEDPKTADKFCENLTHGLVCASSVYEPPLKEFNGGMTNLNLVVNQLSPPGASAVFVNEGNLRITSIHSKCCCLYIGEENAIKRFKKELVNEKTGDAMENSEVVGNHTVESDPDLFSPLACSSFKVGEGPSLLDVGNRKPESKNEVSWDDEVSKAGSEGNRDSEDEDPYGSGEEEDGGKHDDEIGEDEEHEDEDHRGGGSGENSDSDNPSKRMKVDDAAMRVKASDGDNDVRYNHFLQLFDKCVEMNQAKSFRIDIVRSYLVSMEKVKPFSNSEIDSFLDQMAGDNKVMRSDESVFMID